MSGTHFTLDALPCTPGYPPSLCCAAALMQLRHVLRYGLRWGLGGRALLEAFSTPTSAVIASSRAATAPAHISSNSPPCQGYGSKQWRR